MLTATQEIRVRYVETDNMGVVHHANYFAWFEAARVHLLDELGLPYRKLEEQGYLLPVLACSAEFKAPARFDDRLHVTVFIEELPTARIQARYEVKRADQLLATGHTLHAFVSPQGQVIRPPEAFLEKAKECFHPQK